MMRAGTVVTVWFRYEYREPQSTGSVVYNSSVARQAVECGQVAMKTLSVIYYAESNLAGAYTSEAYDASKSLWQPAAPGTVQPQMG
jgi:hypothetical protein